jgi:DNA-binding MarR family transcriptional regulator
MTEEMLIQIGLNSTQAKAYIALVRFGTLTPPELARNTGETRTNAYTILDRLVELGLAKKDDSSKKLVYRVENPVALEKLVKQHRDDALAREKLVKDSMPALLNFFYTYSEQPGVRFFQGKDGLREIHRDQIRTGKPIYFIKSPSDLEFWGFEELHDLRNMYPKHNIKRYSITQDAQTGGFKPEDRIPVEESDKLMQLHRTWIKNEDYDSPVEWAVYGDKVSITSFGEETIGTIIESPQVAASFKQIFTLIQKVTGGNKDYQKLPVNYKYTAKPEGYSQT